MSAHEGASEDLFPPLAFPVAYDGELLYSWCARFHRLSCNTHPKDTSRQLFSHPASGLHHDFPSSLGSLHEISGGQLGTLDDLLFQRTLFGFYRPFLPPSRAAALKLAIEIGGYGKIHSALGLAASLPTQDRRLKACPECMREDFARRPTSFWRTEHQWPAMFLCQRHDQPLYYIQESVAEQSAKQWVLPVDVEECGGWQDLSPITSTMHSRLKTLSEWCCSIVAEPGIQLETTTLRYCYLMQARERGCVAMDGSVRLGRLRDGFFEWINDCATWPGLSFASEIEGANAGFLGQLLRRYQGIHHPLKHIVMMAYLFPSTESFLARHKETSEIYNTDGESGIMRKLTNIRNALLRLVGEENRSVNSAANELGVPVAQATRFLNASDIPYPRKPRIVGTEREQPLGKALRNGKDRAEICRELGIRNSYIKDYLAARPELRTAWESMRAAKLKQEYRNRLLRVLAENPSLPIKRIRRLPKNGFQWLYNNDKDWLREILPAIWKR